HHRIRDRHAVAIHNSAPDRYFPRRQMRFTLENSCGQEQQRKKNTRTNRHRQLLVKTCCRTDYPLLPIQPSFTGSRSSSTPNRSSTPRRILSCNRSISAAVAPPRLINARVCRDEIPAAPSEKPFGNPARSISHAAESFTSPSPAGQCGIGSVQVPAAAMSVSRRASTTGFLKNDPALRQSGSPSTISMPFPRRILLTVEATFSKSITSADLAKYRLTSP